VNPNRTAIVAGGVCWVAKLEFFVAEFIAQAAWPGYSMRDDTISLLGAQLSPRHTVMNGGLILAGILTMAGAMLTRKAWPEGLLTALGIGLVIVAGAGTVGVGLWPVDGNSTLHVASTLLTFFPGGIGVILLGAATMPRHPLFGIVTVAFGAASLGALILFGSDIYFGLGRGGMERVAGYASTLWYVVAGAFLLLPAGGRLR